MNPDNIKGFTLIEVMVAVAVVAIGLIAIFGSFITSFHILKQTGNYNEAILISLEQFWQIQDKVLRGETESLSSGELTEGLKKFKWELSETVIEPYTDLKEIQLKINWIDGKRTGQINWATYLLTDPEE